jgi:Restriction endonuclease
MKTRLTPHYISLLYECCLKSFWRKKALAKFLRQCRISEGFINSWGPGETKRDFLDRLFEKLPTTDKGRQALLDMSLFLIEQSTFPDLQNWEDSEHKINAAQDAISKLRSFHSKQQEELKSDEDRVRARTQFTERQQQVTRSQQSLQKLNERLDALGKSLGEQKAGYDFQDWFYDLLDFSEIENRRPYVHKGRQIDGSLTVSGTTYLVELKFTATQADAHDVDTFFKKVTSKADNTMGVLVSISGYSSVAREEASGDRTPLLLLDHSHLFLVLGGIMSLAEVIARVRRHASQTGEAYLSASEFSG